MISIVEYVVCVYNISGRFKRSDQYNLVVSKHCVLTKRAQMIITEIFALKNFTRSKSMDNYREYAFSIEGSIHE